MSGLSGYRDAATGERPGPLAEDFDSNPPDLTSHQSAPAGDDDDDQADPPPVADPRAALAKRFAERRAAARAGAVPRSHVPNIDGDDITDPSHPDYIAGEDDDDDEASHGRTQQAPAGQEDAQPVRSTTPAGERRFQLKVNGSTLNVTREEAIRYAGLDADEAADLPEPSLLRAAQINLAAEQRLEEAKRASQSRTSVAEPGTPAGEDGQARTEPQQTRRATPGSDTVELARELQYGDPEEAAAKIESYFENKLTQRDTTLSAQRIAQDAVGAIERFGQANDDLNTDDFAADALKTAMVRGIVDELKGVGISDAEATYLLNNPQIATQAYVGARASGMKVRDMDSILTEAGSRVRDRFGMKTREAVQPSQTEQPGRSRRDEKQRLVSQPASSGVPSAPRTRQAAPQDRQALASQRIRQMRAGRHQG